MYENFWEFFEGYPRKFSVPDVALVLVLELWEISRVTLVNSQTQTLPSFSKILEIWEWEWGQNFFENLLRVILENSQNSRMRMRVTFSRILASLTSIHLFFPKFGFNQTWILRAICAHFWFLNLSHCYYFVSNLSAEIII